MKTAALCEELPAINRWSASSAAAFRVWLESAPEDPILALVDCHF